MSAIGAMALSAETLAAMKAIRPDLKDGDGHAISIFAGEAYTDGYNAALADIAEMVEEYAGIDPKIIAAAIRKAALTR